MCVFSSIFHNVPLGTFVHFRSQDGNGNKTQTRYNKLGLADGSYDGRKVLTQVAYNALGEEKADIDAAGVAWLRKNFGCHALAGPRWRQCTATSHRQGMQTIGDVIFSSGSGKNWGDRLKTHGHPDGVAFSPNGSWLATTEGSTVRLWDARPME